MSFIKSITINQTIRNGIFAYETTPHSISFPVLRKVEGKYVLAVFVLNFTKEELMEGSIPRPRSWAMADLKTGELLRRMVCKDTDFSSQPLKAPCPIGERGFNIDQAYFERMFVLLDKVRMSIIIGEKFDGDQYNLYLDRLLTNIPESEIPYYVALNKIEDADTYRKS